MGRAALSKVLDLVPTKAAAAGLARMGGWNGCLVPAQGVKTASSLLEAAQAMEVGTSNCSPGSRDLDQQGTDPGPMTSCGSLVSHLSSLRLSVFTCHMGLLSFTCRGGGVFGPVTAHSRPTANPVNVCQRLHSSQRPPGNKRKAK